MSKDRRERANRRGHTGEWLAAWTLRLKGYTILERGYRSPQGEIDIIAKRLNTVVFVEVKARDTYTDAVNAVSAQQRRRITRAALHYISHHPALAGCDLRFDVIAILPYSWPRHLEDTWQD